MSYNSPLEQAIYNIICDEKIFDIGYVGTSAKISNIILPYIDNSLFNYNISNFKNNVRQVLETRNNCCRNNYINNSKNDYSFLIIRDIALVKKDLKGKYGNNLYLFGCTITNVFNH